jgi:hypothetical protein
LIEISLEYRGVGDVFSGLGELEQNDSGTDLEKAHDYGGDARGGPVESLKEDCGGHNRGAGEEDVVGRSYEGGIEEVECFLFNNQQCEG